MKKCVTCKKEKPLEEFYNDKRAKDGKTFDCKECRRAANKKTHEKHKEKINAYRREVYYKENKETINERNRQNYEKNRERDLQKSAEWYYENRDIISQKRKEKWDSNPELKEKAKVRRREYDKKDPWKRKFYNKYRLAVAQGKIKVMDKCQLCGSKENIEGHHPDYKDPYNVTWLCRLCHRGIHSKRMGLHPISNKNNS